MKPNTKICLKDHPEITGIFERITKDGVHITWANNKQPFCYTNVKETMESVMPVKEH